MGVRWRYSGGEMEVYSGGEMEVEWGKMGGIVG